MLVLNLADALSYTDKLSAGKSFQQAEELAKLTPSPSCSERFSQCLKYDLSPIQRTLCRCNYRRRADQLLLIGVAAHAQMGGCLEEPSISSAS